MPLYRPHRPPDLRREGVHARPAEAIFVRRVIRERTVRNEGLGGNSGGDQLFSFRYAGKLQGSLFPVAGWGLFSSDHVRGEWDEPRTALPRGRSHPTLPPSGLTFIVSCSFDF
jgi:hypothetical protein